MDSNEPNGALDDALALEKVAVGPYCIFDDFRPTTASPSDEVPGSPIERTNNMEDPMMSNEFPFSAGMRAPWLSSAAEDLSLVQTADSFPQGNWEEWMRWDPNSQPPPPSDINAQGPVCFFKPDMKQAVFNRQTSQETQPHGLPARMNDIPFSFGESMDNAPAFAFGNNDLSSPPVTEAQQQGNFFRDNNPVWTDNQQLDQGDNGLFSPLSFDQNQAQAMSRPPHSTPSLHHSPSSVNSGTHPHTSSSSQQSSPEPSTHGGSKKRKSIIEDESPDTKSGKQPPVKKTAHNMIEKRYRTNLNDKIAALRDSVPSLRVMSRANHGAGSEDDPEDLEGLTPAHKLNKATVLSKATEYIRHLEKRNKRLNDEVDTLKARLESYDKFAMTTPMTMATSVNTPDGMRYQHEDPFAAAAARTQPVSQASGMIPVPESITNLQMQNHYAQQQGGYPVFSQAPGRQGMQAQHQQQQQQQHQQQHMVNGRRSNGMMSKLMVGSLAGLMIVEGFKEHEESGENTEGRGLFALPVSLFGRYGAAMLPKFAAHGMSTVYRSLPLIKLFLAISAFLYLVMPLLDSKPKSKKKAIPSIKLSPAPSPASPVEVRRKAWLTAIQTVWVPRHNFVLEAAAVSLKFAKLSLLNLIGWNRYASLIGLTKEQEAARVKAWEIALDAQLTGGDAEISKSRLVLTIMASGTLPDTPARLMLKAMHIRILLWEVANAGYGSWYMFEEVSAKLARKYWNQARSHQKMLQSGAVRPADVEALPEHLAALLELECDDVMVDRIVQRAYNLAWNKPSAENTEADDAMDSVVEDFAISSPLDALAAWYSSFALNSALVSHLEDGGISEDLDLAIRTAPPNSVAQVRALVAKAILVKEDRNANITVAFDALPSQPHIPALKNAKLFSPRALLMNVVGEAPIAADVRKSLTLVKCLALAEKFSASWSEEVRVRATFVINNTFLPDSSLTLLSFVAAYKVLRIFSEEERLLAESRQGLERIASSMRVWIGREAGRRSGLNSKTKGKIVESCLSVSKMLVGMQDHMSEEGDAGYASQSDHEIDVRKY